MSRQWLALAVHNRHPNVILLKSARSNHETDNQ